MTEHLLGKKRAGTGKHRDTGRQRSEPEEGKHARQPEGPTGRLKKLPIAAVRSHPQHRPNAAGAAGLVHAAATWFDNYKAVEQAVAAEQLASIKQPDGKRLVKKWRFPGCLACLALGLPARAFLSDNRPIRRSRNRRRLESPDSPPPLA